LMDFAAREISSKEGVAASSWIYGNVGSLSKMDNLLTYCVVGSHK